MLIKYILLVLIAYILVGIIRKFLSRKIHSHEMAFWLIFWALAAVVLIVVAFAAAFGIQNAGSFCRVSAGT